MNNLNISVFSGNRLDATGEKVNLVAQCPPEFMDITSGDKVYKILKTPAIVNALSAHPSRYFMKPDGTIFRITGLDTLLPLIEKLGDDEFSITKLLTYGDSKWPYGRSIDWFEKALIDMIASQPGHVTSEPVELKIICTFFDEDLHTKLSLFITNGKQYAVSRFAFSTMHRDFNPAEISGDIDFIRQLEEMNLIQLDMCSIDESKIYNPEIDGFQMRHDKAIYRCVKVNWDLFLNIFDSKNR